MDVGTVQSSCAHFHETWRDEEGAKGWRHERGDAKSPCQFWLSAVSVQALGSIVRMLDARINQLVLKHFSVRRPTKLGLESLYYADYGLVAARVAARASP